MPRENGKKPETKYTAYNFLKMDFQNIGSTFSSKSDLILSEIIKKNNLNEDAAIIPLTAVIMYFSRNEISSAQMIDIIKKEFNISQQAAQQIAKEMQEKIIPTLWNYAPVNEKTRPEAVEAVVPVPQEPKQEIVKPKRAKKVIPEISPVPPAVEKPRQSSGPDRYREPLA